MIIAVGQSKVQEINKGSSTQQSQSTDPNIPIVDFDADRSNANLSEADRLARQRKNSRHQNQRDFPIKESEGGIALTFSHWWLNLPALPVDQSDAGQIGTVKKAEAFITEEKKGIYSEFSIQVSQVLKTKNDILTITPPQLVVAERVGGAVRFPSGTVQIYRDDKMHFPRIDSPYVLFLKREEQGNITIITGYMLLDTRVYPLDDAPAFETYKGKPESVLLADLRVAIEKGGQSDSGDTHSIENQAILFSNSPIVSPEAKFVAEASHSLSPLLRL